MNGCSSGGSPNDTNHVAELGGGFPAGPGLRQVLPKLADFGPSLTEFRPNLVDFWPIWVDSRPLFVELKSCQTWPIAGQIWSKAGICSQILGRCWPNSGRTWPIQGRIRRNWSNSAPNRLGYFPGPLWCLSGARIRAPPPPARGHPSNDGLRPPPHHRESGPRHRGARPLGRVQFVWPGCAPRRRPPPRRLAHESGRSGGLPPRPFLR